MYHYFRDMAEEDISQEFRLKKKKKKERNDYFIKEIEQNELMSNKNKICTTLNYTAHFLTLVFWVTRGISIFTFAPHFAILRELWVLH